MFQECFVTVITLPLHGSNTVRTFSICWGKLDVSLSFLPALSLSLAFCLQKAVKGQSRALDRLRKKMNETESCLLLHSPTIPFRIHNKHGKVRTAVTYLEPCEGTPPSCFTDIRHSVHQRELLFF